jgi:NAD(P)H dehydrogenase (quinone)
MSLSQTSAPRPRIAVAGATGRVGSALMASLAADPVDLVALTRKPDPARFSPQVVQAAVDFDAPPTLRKALEGADRLFLAQGTSARQAENEIALIDAALAAGVEHIVKLSSCGPPTRLHPFDWHTRIETHLSTQEIGWTFLRPTTFVDILARAGRPVIEGSWGGAAGEGNVNMIDTRDVADCARAVLLDPRSTNWQRAYHLTGPRAWSMEEVADEMSRCFGRTVTYHHRTPAEQRVVLLDSGLSEFVADLLLGLDQTVYESMLAETTSTVQMLTAHAPRTLPDWLAQNIALFAQ